MEFFKNIGIPEWEFRLVIGRTRIEFDDSKEDENRRKHKYSLASAVYVLEEILLSLESRPYLVSDAFMEGGEVRHMLIGLDDAGHVVIFVTTMRRDEVVRIISFRRANVDERAIFERETGYTEGAT